MPNGVSESAHPQLVNHRLVRAKRKTRGAQYRVAIFVSQADSSVCSQTRLDLIAGVNSFSARRRRPDHAANPSRVRPECRDCRIVVCLPLAAAVAKGKHALPNSRYRH
jgi:hypothetical protein